MSLYRFLRPMRRLFRVLLSFRASTNRLNSSWNDAVKVRRDWG